MGDTQDREYDNGLPGFSLRRLFQYFSTLCGIGVRWAGTKGEEESATRIYEFFSKLGVAEVHFEEFDYLSYTPKSTTTDMMSPTSANLPCEPLEYSANGSVEGEMVYVGSGREEEFAELERVGVDFSDKIVAARSITPFWIMPLAEKRACAGLLIITDPPQNLIRKFTAKLYPPPAGPPLQSHVCRIPGVAVSLRDGERLLRNLSRGKVKVSISHEGVYSEKKSRNIIATIHGGDLADENVVVGGHYDTQRVGGAWDNATGVACVLELANVMLNLHPRRTLIFAAFGCEEVGLWGSTRYVEKHRTDSVDKCVYMCNLDAVSSALCPLNYMWTTPQIGDFAYAAASKAGWRIDSLDDLRLYRDFSDCGPFVDAGVPSTWVWEGPVHPYYHTEGDTPEHVDLQKLTRTLRVSGNCVFEAAYSPNLSKSSADRR